MRIRVVGGPWPERIGCTGRVVTEELDPKIYPRAGLGRYETIIHLDDDPLVTPPCGDYHCFHNHDRQRGWSCVIDFRDVEPLQ
jgi:hypothetical protein